MRRWVVVVTLARAVLAFAPPAGVPSSTFAAGGLAGRAPGPPLLYAPKPKVPQLSVRRPFRAPPLLVSGTDAYRRGEYLYQDHLYDDHGANTRPGSSSPPGSASFSPTAGDVLYSAVERFASNAADLVELRIRPTRAALVYRVTLNTVLDDDAAAVVIGVDRDRSGSASVAWPARRRRQLARRRRLHRGVGHRRRGVGAGLGRQAPAARGGDDRSRREPNDDPRGPVG
jgi:hypothetical protein